jgi:hypothetical protein
MICTYCKHRVADSVAIDVSKMFNCSEDLVHVCSKECKKELVTALKEGFPFKAKPFPK